MSAVSSTDISVK